MTPDDLDAVGVALHDAYQDGGSTWPSIAQVAISTYTERLLARAGADTANVAAHLAMSYGAHVSPPEGGKDWRAAEGVCDRFIAPLAARAEALEYARDQAERGAARYRAEREEARADATQLRKRHVDDCEFCSEEEQKRYRVEAVAEDWRTRVGSAPAGSFIREFADDIDDALARPTASTDTPTWACPKCRGSGGTGAASNCTTCGGSGVRPPTQTT